MHAPNFKNESCTLHKAQESSFTPVSQALNQCNVASQSAQDKSERMLCQAWLQTTCLSDMTTYQGQPEK